MPSPAPTENAKTSQINSTTTTMSTMDDIENDGSDDADENDDGEIATIDDKRRDIFSPFDNSDHISTCSPPCSERTSCGNCTHGLCMWCKNLEMCIERNAYLVIKILKMIGN